MNSFKFSLSLLAALVAVLAMSATAVAQEDPATRGYQTPGEQTLGQVGDDDAQEVGGDNAAGGNNPAGGGGDTGTTTPVANATSGNDGGSSLPFTGFDLALLGIAGALLAVAGVGMRRLVRTSDVA